MASTSDSSKSYHLVTDEVEWIEANVACLDNGGSLATFTTADEITQLIGIGTLDG